MNEVPRRGFLLMLSAFFLVSGVTYAQSREKVCRIGYVQRATVNAGAALRATATGRHTSHPVSCLRTAHAQVERK